MTWYARSICQKHFFFTYEGILMRESFWVKGWYSMCELEMFVSEYAMMEICVFIQWTWQFDFINDRNSN